jgi:hypothetical protein
MSIASTPLANLGSPEKTFVRLTSFSNNDVFLPEELTCPRPEPCMGDNMIILLRHRCYKFRNFNHVGVVAEGMKASGESREQMLHANTREVCILDVGVGGMELVARGGYCICMTSANYLLQWCAKWGYGR